MSMIQVGPFSGDLYAKIHTKISTWEVDEFAPWRGGCWYANYNPDFSGIEFTEAEQLELEAWLAANPRYKRVDK